jgi:hypothetical protein
LGRYGGRDHGSERDRVGELLMRGQLDEAERLLHANPGWLEGNWGDGILPATVATTSSPRSCA